MTELIRKAPLLASPLFIFPLIWEGFSTVGSAQETGGCLKPRKEQLITQFYLKRNIAKHRVEQIVVQYRPFSFPAAILDGDNNEGILLIKVLFWEERRCCCCLWVVTVVTAYRDASVLHDYTDTQEQSCCCCCLRVKQRPKLQDKNIHLCSL